MRTGTSAPQKSALNAPIQAWNAPTLNVLAVTLTETTKTPLQNHFGY